MSSNKNKNRMTGIYDLQQLYQLQNKLLIMLTSYNQKWKSLTSLKILVLKWEINKMHFIHLQLLHIEDFTGCAKVGKNKEIFLHLQRASQSSITRNTTLIFLCPGLDAIYTVKFTAHWSKQKKTNPYKNTQILCYIWKAFIKVKEFWGANPIMKRKRN